MKVWTSWLSRLLCGFGLHQPITTWGNETFIGGYCVRCVSPWRLPAGPTS